MHSLPSPPPLRPLRLSMQLLSFCCLCPYKCNFMFVFRFFFIYVFVVTDVIFVVMVVIFVVVVVAGAAIIR